MALKRLEPENWRRKFSRCLLIGPPNAWKTSSLRTWPQPMAYIAFPGELGISSVSLEGESIGTHWEQDPITKSSPTAVLREVRTWIVEVLSGKHGQFETFAGDGIHKLYDLVYQAMHLNLVDAFGDKIDEEKLRGMAYGRAHGEFRDIIQQISQSTINNVVMTAWSSMERDNPDDQRSKKHVWPGLPGTMGQDIVGEFGAVMYARPGIEVAPSKYSEGQWQTRRHGDVWGVGLKLPVEISSKIPTMVKQDWSALLNMTERLAKEGTK